MLFRSLIQYIVKDTTQTDYYVGYAGQPNSLVNNILVYLNSTAIPNQTFSTVVVKNKLYVRLNNTALALNDRIDIKIYATFAMKDYYYQVPENLEVNPANESFTELTLGQLRRHIQDVFEKSKETTNTYPGPSNLRDLPLIKNSGGKILQHAGNMITAGLFLCHPELNFMTEIGRAHV